MKTTTVFEVYPPKSQTCFHASSALEEAQKRDISSSSFSLVVFGHHVTLLFQYIAQINSHEMDGWMDASETLSQPRKNTGFSEK